MRVDHIHQFTNYVGFQVRSLGTFTTATIANLAHQSRNYPRFPRRRCPQFAVVLPRRGASASTRNRSIKLLHTRHTHTLFSCLICYVQDVVCSFQVTLLGPSSFSSLAHGGACLQGDTPRTREGMAVESTSV
jgi:hypothetical protein